MIISVIAGSLSLFGAAFVLVAALGILRMEDVFTRLHGASKAAPFGATLTLLGVGVQSGSADVIVRVLIICAFLLLTTPIAAHLIARAAYLEGTGPGPGAHDDLEGKYDLANRELHSGTVREVRKTDS